MSNNFYNPSIPWIITPTDPTQQPPGYAGFNNFQRSIRPSTIPGRLVNNLDEITPQEVPMDGSVSLFPQNDYSAIYAKTWTKDGTILKFNKYTERKEDDMEIRARP